MFSRLLLVLFTLLMCACTQQQLDYIRSDEFRNMSGRMSNGEAFGSAYANSGTPPSGSNQTQQGLDPNIGPICNKTGETTNGVNRICYYNCAGSTAAYTVNIGQMCPMTIKQ